jgi:ligand-binding SRPBCC domain-containing protein
MPRLEFTCDIAAPVETVWAFYDSLETLVKITPPATKVRIVDPPLKLQTGVRFTMMVQQPPLFIPLPWECLITAHDPPHLFVDEQGKGPFAKWRHVHKFEPLPNGGTRLTDTITYEPPLGFLGAIADRLFLRRMLERMFAHRYAVTRQALET